MTGMYCSIRVQGHLSEQWDEWFEGLTIINEEQGSAILSGVLADEAALYGTLMKIRDLGLVLLSVTRSRSAEERP